MVGLRTHRWRRDVGDWETYYKKTRDGSPDPVLAFACARVPADLPRVAVDCGCGGGRGSAFLLDQGFEVHGFDADPASEQFCLDRFLGDHKAHFTTATFASFDYPRASLVTASYSLFFCAAEEFDIAWRNITAAVMPGGVFAGTFLGPDDTWVELGHVTEMEDEKIIAHSESEVRELLAGFDILEMDIKRFNGETALGEKKLWHTITVVGQRNP